MHSAARCLLCIIYIYTLTSPPMLIYASSFRLLGFSLLGIQGQQSAINPFLPDEKTADKRESHSCSHKGKSFVG